ASTGRVGAGEENPVDRLLDERASRLAATDDRDEGVFRNAARMEQPRDLEAGERGEFRWLVEHRVAGEQRGQEHVAADEPGVIPRGDVGDHAERLVRDALAHAGIVRDVARFQRLRGFWEGEIDALQDALAPVARL